MFSGLNESQNSDRGHLNRKFRLVKMRINENKKLAMIEINHEIRKLKRERALLRADIAANKDTLAELKTMLKS